ncbi:hypothetical protein LSH36_4g12016 [Paralvinella palmiformis]|uniref:Uncharacterized protein n=1 Tax=Paralvinella palmiformis TaxID=53620 RepID=A0AAD9NIU4_9ANNE|nr:hypothetical protein LSH36_4g12016 [Paralvinella palmiformis]
MKPVVCLSMAALLIVIISSADSKILTPGSSRRVARGFRLGAADRFSHGFGKRNGEGVLKDILTNIESEVVLTNEEFAELLRSDPKLASIVVQNLVDKNANTTSGYQNHLFPNDVITEDAPDLVTDAIHRVGKSGSTRHIGFRAVNVVLSRVLVVSSDKRLEEIMRVRGSFLFPVVVMIS